MVRPCAQTGQCRKISLENARFPFCQSTHEKQIFRLLVQLLRELIRFEFCTNCVPAKERNETDGCCNPNESCTPNRCRRPDDRYDVMGKLGCRD